MSCLPNKKEYIKSINVVINENPGKISVTKWQNLSNVKENRKKKKTPF